MVRTFRFSTRPVAAPTPRRPDLRRRQDAARRRARRRAPGAGRRCRWPAWSWSATAPTPRQRARRVAAGAQAAGRAGVHRRRRPRDAAERDIQIGRVTTPRTALKGTTLMIDVVVTQTGYAGQTLTLDVEDERPHRRQRSTSSCPTTASGDGARAVHRVGAGAARVPLPRARRRTGELVTENNARDALIDVRDRREKILYFEGEPRFEMKFIRRAVHRRQEPAAGRAAAHGRQQVPAARRRRPRRARRRLPEDARRAVRSIAASSSAASRPARSPAISCG